MKPAPPPPDEDARLAALLDLKLLDTMPEASYDRITRTVQRLFGVPIALVSLIDADRQWFKSVIGLDVTETHRDLAFCAHAILDAEPLIVPDATLDLRFHDNPLVVDGPNIRFYAGCPISGPSGHRLGTLCAIDRQARTIDPTEILLLQDLAAWVEAEIARHAHEQFMTCLPEAVVTFDRDGTILSANTRAEIMRGGRLVGCNVRDLVEDAASLPRARDHEIIATRAQTASGDVRDVEINLTRLPRGQHQDFLAVIRDVSARIQAERALRDANDRLDLILRSAAEGICGVDRDGRLTFVNAAGARILGGAHLGEEAHAVLHGQQCDDAACALRNMQKRTALIGGRCTCRRGDGSTALIEYICAPMRLEGATSGTVVSLRDISEKDAVERMKDEFVAVVSHELRTPLTSIRGSLSLLAGGAFGPLPEKGGRMVEIAVSNTDRLVRLINDILDFERIKSGAAQMERTAVASASLIEHAIETMRAQADAAGVRLVAKGADFKVLADPDRIIQTLTNLLGNAIKFSPAGAEVIVSTAASGDGVKFSVCDKGRGIPRDKLDTIFERFGQVESADARVKGGSGLGLAICKSIVEQHGGRLEVESEVGCGSTFTFTLDRPLEAASATIVVRDRGEESRMTSRLVEAGFEVCGTTETGAAATNHVVVLESDADVADTLAAEVERHGIHAWHARDIQDALQMTADGLPALLIVDDEHLLPLLRQHRLLRKSPLAVLGADELSPGGLGPAILVTSDGALGDVLDRLLGARRETGSAHTAERGAPQPST